MRLSYAAKYDGARASISADIGRGVRVSESQDNIE
jgi:hypothetical protein